MVDQWAMHVKDSGGKPSLILASVENKLDSEI